MQFCKDCGAVLNLFANDEQELCSTCIQQQKRLAQPPPIPAVIEERPFELLDDATISCENNKVILRSKEGWELWSAPLGSPTAIKTLLSRAERIYQIRLKRQKN